MLNFGILSSTNRYESPYGSVKLQNNIKKKIEENKQCDTFSYRAAKTAKKAGTAAIGIGAAIASGIAVFKNKEKLVSLLKKVPEFFSKNKNAANNAIITVPYKVVS